jgi:hypothetical protein
MMFPTNARGASDRMQIHELFKDLSLGVHPQDYLAQDYLAQDYLTQANLNMDASHSSNPIPINPLRGSAGFISSPLETSFLASSPDSFPREETFPEKFSTSPSYSMQSFTEQSFTDEPATPQSVSSRHLSKVLQNAFNEEGQKSLWQLDFAELKVILENTQASKLSSTCEASTCEVLDFQHLKVSFPDEIQEEEGPSAKRPRSIESSISQELLPEPLPEPLTVEWIIQTAQRRYEDDSLKGKAVMPHCYVIQQMGPLGKTLFPDFMKKLKRRLNSQVQSKVKTLKMNLTRSPESI